VLINEASGEKKPRKSVGGTKSSARQIKRLFVTLRLLKK